VPTWAIVGPELSAAGSVELERVSKEARDLGLDLPNGFPRLERGDAPGSETVVLGYCTQDELHGSIEFLKAFFPGFQAKPHPAQPASRACPVQYRYTFSVVTIPDGSLTAAIREAGVCCDCLFSNEPYRWVLVMARDARGALLDHFELEDRLDNGKQETEECTTEVEPSGGELVLVQECRRGTRLLSTTQYHLRLKDARIRVKKTAR
jgi:hypothetical protein